MVKRVRTKFIIIGTAATVVVTVMLIMAINLFHAIQTGQYLDSVLLEMSQTRQDVQERGNENGNENGRKYGRKNRFSVSTQYAGRFFRVHTDESGEIISQGEDEISDELSELVQSVLNSGQDKGMADEYRYLVQKSENGAYIFFLDCATESRDAEMLLTISAAVGAAGVFISFLFILFMSEKIILPLKESMEKQKQFITDAGHELKTPLSVIGTNMDILSMDMGENEWVDGTKKQVKKLRRLVNHLISLSRIEETGTELSLQAFDVSSAAEESVQPFRNIANEEEKEVKTEIEGGLTALGDEMTIRQLFTILCDNAIKYSVGKEPVIVKLFSEKKHIYFETVNDWEYSSAPDSLDRFFDRFYRGDISRNRNSETGNYGLGLAIAKGIAQKNRIQLTVHEDEKKRIIFRAVF